MDINNYKKDGTVCKSCYNRTKNKRKKKSKTLLSVKTTNSHQQTEIENVSDRNRPRIVGVSNCGKTYLMNHTLLRKQEPIFVITKSMSQYPDIKAQISDEIQPVNEYENSTVVLLICYY